MPTIGQGLCNVFQAISQALLAILLHNLLYVARFEAVGYHLPIVCVEYQESFDWLVKHDG